MITAIIAVFVIGYLFIALEHTVRIDKAATALAIGSLAWALYVLGAEQMDIYHAVPQAFMEHATHSMPGMDHHQLVVHYMVEGQLLPLVGEIGYILFFLMGAMTIVEIVDAYEGFSLITERIKSRNALRLLWIVCWLTFFLSAVLDNLTTTIVMVSLMKKLAKDQRTRLFFAGMIVIAANAGGAWTVIGDVTTTMLWIKGKLSEVEVMKAVILPSIVCLLVPLICVSFILRGDIERPDRLTRVMHKNLSPFHQYLFLTLGVVGLLFVPAFKMVTHLPPFMGMILSLSVIWIVSELIKHNLDEETRSSTHVLEILKRIDSASILFFLGILLAIGCLAATGTLDKLAVWLDTTAGGNLRAVAVVIGLASAVVDNVPLVAAGIEMYNFPKDDSFWLFLAYCAGTGGSCLIIGSAAGVAAMGLEHINFVWYLKRIAPLALVGYLAGAGTYLVQEQIFPPTPSAVAPQSRDTAAGTHGPIEAAHEPGASPVHDAAAQRALEQAAP
jgi:Na+/H+ antiporter NhaD/arsenite permease-like protein